MLDDDDGNEGVRDLKGLFFQEMVCIEPIHIIVHGNYSREVDHSSRYFVQWLLYQWYLDSLQKQTRKHPRTSHTHVVDNYQSKELSHTWQAPLSGRIPSPRYHSLPNHLQPSLQMEVSTYFPINTKSHITSTHLLSLSPMHPRALLLLVPSNPKA